MPLGLPVPDLSDTRCRHHVSLADWHLGWYTGRLCGETKQLHVTNSSCAWHEYVCLLRCFHYFCQLAHADTTLALDISADMDDNKEPPLGKDGKPLPAMVEVLSMAPPWAKYPDYEKVRSWGHCRPSSFDLGMENEGGSTALVWLSGGVSGRLLLSKPLAELHPIASSLQRWQSADSVAEQRCDTHAVQKGLAGCCQRLGPLPHMLGT